MKRRKGKRRRQEDAYWEEIRRTPGTLPHYFAYHNGGMTEEESNACPYCKAQNEEYERKQKEFEAKKAELEREEKARYKWLKTFD